MNRHVCVTANHGLGLKMQTYCQPTAQVDSLVAGKKKREIQGDTSMISLMVFTSRERLCIIFLTTQCGRSHCQLRSSRRRLRVDSCHETEPIVLLLVPLFGKKRPKLHKFLLGGEDVYLRHILINKNAHGVVQDSLVRRGGRGI